MPPSLPSFTVTRQEPGVYGVEIFGPTKTTHRVEVPAGLAERLGGNGTTDEQLVEESFRLLLERESNTSILRTFTIEKIGDYFPEWSNEIGRRLKT
jgi:hypothetical protein